ncbi:MAG TPA: hypothetical protein VOB72_03265 [Candidatus Dormibacteraeota bacterium]|nr:hypothetical protein [Candidatus Dormibacteraeota bacterium]
MARKTKRRQPARSARRPATQGGPGTATTAAPRQAGTRQGADARVGGDQALVRSVEMSLAPGPPVRRGGRIVLEGGDPAIPLDRVPYFLTDLARLGIVAAAMVVLLVVGALFVIPLLIK